MCGIIGVSSDRNVVPFILDGLERETYRGYDSAGIGILQDGLRVWKSVGPVSGLERRFKLRRKRSVMGIGQTRWASVGEVNQRNAHPFFDCTRSLVIAHNGTITNYKRLRAGLEARGHRFTSDTDSEVIAHIVEESRGSVSERVLSAIDALEGSNAFVVAFDDGVLAGVRRGLPLILGIGEQGLFLSSDVIGFMQNTHRAIFMGDYEVAVLRGTTYALYDRTGEISRRPEDVAWEVSAAKTSDYTRREILEQEATIDRTVQSSQAAVERVIKVLDNRPIFIIGSGSSYNAALFLKYLLNDMGRECEVLYAQESQSLAKRIHGGALIAISQSGETADILEAVRQIRGKAPVVAITNVPGSSLVRLADYVLFLDCGPEIGVAATKSFTSQLAISYLIAAAFQKRRFGLKLQPFVLKIVKAARKIKELAIKLTKYNGIYVIGNGANYAIAREGALKLKELTYIFSEGLLASELKHGPLASLGPGTLVILLNPPDETYERSLHIRREVEARNAPIIVIGSDADATVRIPRAPKPLYPLLEVIVLQLLAYYAAKHKNINPDRPRNIAKVLTVP